MPQPIRQFEDIIAWQKARVLTRDVYLATRDDNFRKDFGLASQIQRAAVSIMANIAEGYERKGPGEFYRFLGIAKASCAEVGSHLYVALDTGYLSQPQFDQMHRQVKEIGRILGSFQASVGRARDGHRENSTTKESE
jgi:four helix bundle protein